MKRSPLLVTFYIYIYIIYTLYNYAVSLSDCFINLLVIVTQNGPRAGTFLWCTGVSGSVLSVILRLEILCPGENVKY